MREATTLESPKPSTASPRSWAPSPLETFRRLPPDQQHSLLEQLAADAGCTVPQIKARLAYTWEGWQARPSQHEPDAEWLYWLIKAGRGFGKTRIGAEWIRKQARTCGRLHLIAPTAADYRDVMVEGESGIKAISPRHERPTFYPSRRQLVWPNGAQALCFSGEDPESLRGPQCEKLWADEIAAWQYPQETWDMALLGLRLGQDPRAVITSTPKPIPVVKELVVDPDSVVTGGSTYENLGNLGATYRTIIGRYEGTRLGRQELYAELLDDEGLAYKFSERVHVVESFDPPESWERFESMDYGSAPTSATAWLCYAVDYDGNLVVTDEFYEPGLPSDIVARVLPLRNRWHSEGSESRARPDCFADPAIFNPGQTTNRWGTPAVVNDEFEELGVILTRANNDRRAGYIRVSELLKLREASPPKWAHHLEGSDVTPRLFVMAHCKETIAALKDAPLEEDTAGPYKGPFPGEAVAQKWEAGHGHAHASLRYGVMSRPSPSVEPVKVPDDPRARLLHELRVKADSPASRYERV